MNERANRGCPCPSRRGVIRLACAVGVGVGVTGCGTPGGSQPSGPLAGGNIKDLPPGSFRVMGEIAIGHDSGGVYAMSAICTHAGCPTQVSGSGLFCPCHGSRFDENGDVTRGPARASLPHYQVDVAADGTITVQAGTIVAATTRMAPT